MCQNSESNENSSSKLEEEPVGWRSVSAYNMLKNKELRVSEFTHSPLPRSFSGNGLRLTNGKTSFAAGFGLLHWSNLEGEFRPLLHFDTLAVSPISAVLQHPQLDTQLFSSLLSNCKNVSIK